MPSLVYAADNHGVTVTLADGEHLRAPLLVAADGRASPLREAAGIGVVGWQYRQVGIVTTVRHEKPHSGRAIQHFLPGGPFAILPLKGNRSCITWTEEENEGRSIVALDDGPFLAQVERRFGYRLGRIELAGPRGVWPLGDASGSRAGGRPSGAGGRRGASGASDRWPGPEPGATRCCGPDRGSGRRRAARPRYRLQHRARRATSAGGAPMRRCRLPPSTGSTACSPATGRCCVPRAAPASVSSIACRR